MDLTTEQLLEAEAYLTKKYGIESPITNAIKSLEVGDFQYVGPYKRNTIYTHIHRYSDDKKFKITKLHGIPNGFEEIFEDIYMIERTE